jgi:Flp pilus assembly protein TadD
MTSSVTRSALATTLLLLLWCLPAQSFADQASQEKASELFARATKWFAGSEYAKAAADLVESLQLDPRQPRAAKLLGVCYQILGDLKQAETRFREAAKLDEGDGETWFFLGRACYMEHQFDDAVTALNKAVRVDPANPQAHELLAMTLETNGHTDAALVEYAEAVRRNRAIPKPLATPLLSYGVFLHKLNRLDESEKQLRAAADLNPKDWMTHFELGKLYYDRGRFEAAEQELIAASHTAQPQSEDAARVYRLLGRTYYRLGREDEARRAIAMAGQ